MKNKFSTFLLALLMTVSSTFYFVGCGGNNNNSNESSNSGNPPAEHTHTYDTEWENDENYHWHKATCEHTSEVSDKGEHVWDAGVETEEATYDSEGEMLFTCTVCGKTYTEVIEMKDFSIDPNEVEVSDIHRLHTDGMLAYLQGDKEDVFNYTDGSEERSIPKAVSLTWDAVQGATQYSITIAENRDLTDGLTYASNTNSIDIYNCKARTTYFYQVSVNVSGTVEKGEVSYFMTDATLPRIIKCDGVTNMRDLGGYVAGDKVVKQGMIYRSGRLNKSDSETLVPEITAEGINTMLNELKIKTEIDMRRPLSVSNEVGSLNGKSVLGDSVNYYHCGMEWVGGAWSSTNYESVRKIFHYFADENNYPIVFHCNIGTDRTGYISYLLGGLLGVEKETLLRDYLMSNFGKIGGTRALSGVSTYIDAIDNTNGTTLAEKTENYLVNVVGVSRSDIESIRKIMLEEYSFTSKTIKEPTATEDGFKYYECLQDSSKSYFELLSKTVDNGVFVSVGNGVTVMDLSGNAIGNTVAVGTKVKVTITNNDKTKIARLYMNAEDTGYFVVNNTQTFEYTITEPTLFNLHWENYHIYFDALSKDQTIKDAIAEKEQGVNADGYLAGPNYAQYSGTQTVNLNKNTVFETTLEINQGYAFGIRFLIGETEYRILARPWFRIDGVGDYRYGHISIWRGSTQANYELVKSIENDELTIKLIFDSKNEKVYAFVNGQNFTEELNANYTSSDTARIHFYYCCETDGEPGLYKEWSVLTGDSIVAEELENIFGNTNVTYDETLVIKAADGTLVADGERVDYGEKIYVTFSSSEKTKLVKLYANGVDTGYFVVNGSQTVEIQVTETMDFTLVEEVFPMTFTADNAAQTDDINSREQGLNVDGYLVGPNFNGYSSTEKITLVNNTVFETTLKLNNAYAFGVVFDFGNGNWLRIQARPWFRLNGVGDFYSNYIQITNFVGSENTKQYALSEAPANDEVTIKVIFDTEEGKIYLLINGENYSDKVSVPYTATDTVKVRFNYMCEKDTTTPGYYKDWSIVSGKDIVAEEKEYIKVETPSGFVNSKDMMYLTQTEGGVTYKVSAKVGEITFADYVEAQYSNATVLFETEIMLPSKNIAGLLIKDDKGNYITVRFVNERLDIYKPGATTAYRGNTLANRGLTVDGNYVLSIVYGWNTNDEGELEELVAFKADSGVFAALTKDNFFAADSTKLEFYYIWTDDNTMFTDKNYQGETIITDGMSTYKVSDEIKEITFLDYSTAQWASNKVALFETEIIVSSESEAGLLIKDNRGNYITVRILNGKLEVYKSGGVKIRDRAISNEESYVIRVMYGWSGNEQIIGIEINGTMAVALDKTAGYYFADDATKLEFYYIWNDNDTTFNDEY